MSKSECIEMLNRFDMVVMYGPSIGITRAVRWNRAFKFGFKPPADILTILKSYPNDKVVQLSHL